MSKEPLKVIQEFKEAGKYKLKGVSAPKCYLGGNLHQHKVDIYTCYETHAKTYITHIIDKIEKLMEWSLRSYMSPEDPNYSLEQLSRSTRSNTFSTCPNHRVNP